MLAVLSRYGLAAHLAIVAVAPLFLPPIASLWLAGLAFLWLLLEPSRIGGESLYEARSRVLRTATHDPLFWVLLFLVLVAGTRALNVGIDRAYDAESGVWELAAAPSPILPGCVDGFGLPLFSLAVCAWVVLTGCRHAIGRSARFGFLLIASFLAAVGVYVWAVLLAKGDGSAYHLAQTSMEDPSFLGSACGVYLGFGVLALIASFELKWFSAMPLVILAIAGNAAGVFLFAPPLVTIVFLGVAMALFFAGFAFLRIRLGNPAEYKYLVVFGISLAIALLVVLGVVPRELESAKIAPYLDDASFLPDGYNAARNVLADVSRRAWMGNPWLGNGLGSFSLSLSFLATSADWAVVSPCQLAPLNGYWFVLAERGVMGAFMLAVPLVLILITYVGRLVCGIRLGMPHPLILLGPLMLLAAGFEMWGAVSFMSAGALLPLAAALVLSPHGFVKESSHG